MLYPTLIIESSKMSFVFLSPLVKSYKIALRGVLRLRLIHYFLISGGLCTCFNAITKGGYTNLCLDQIYTVEQAYSPWLLLLRLYGYERLMALYKAVIRWIFRRNQIQ